MFTTSPDRHHGAAAGRRRIATLLAVLAATAVGVAGCSSDGTGPIDSLPREGAPQEPAPEEPAPAPEPEPEPEPAPAPEPEPEPAPDEPAEGSDPADDGDGTTSEETIVVILLLVTILGVIAGLIAWLSRRSSARGQADETLRGHVAAISARTRWIIDQGVISLLGTTEPAQLQAAWTSLSTAMLDAQRDLALVSPQLSPDGARASAGLENALNGLRGSAESGHQTRLQHADQPELVAAADRTILAQRDQLLHALIAFESVAT